MGKFNFFNKKLTKLMSRSEAGGSVLDVELPCKIMSMECQRNFESEQLINSEEI